VLFDRNRTIGIEHVEHVNLERQIAVGEGRGITHVQIQRLGPRRTTRTAALHQLTIAVEVAVAVVRRDRMVAEAVDRTTRLHQQVATDGPLVVDRVVTEQLQGVATVIRQVAVGTFSQFRVVEVLGDVGIVLTDIRLHATFAVALALRPGVGTLQEELVPAAFEEHLDGLVGALGFRTKHAGAGRNTEQVAVLPSIFGTQLNGFQRAVAVDVHAEHHVVARVVQMAEREARVVGGNVAVLGAILRLDEDTAIQGEAILVGPLDDRTVVAGIVDGALQVTVDTTDTDREVVVDLLLEA